MLANEVMRKQYVFPGMKDQTAKTVQEYLGVGLKTTTQTQVSIALMLGASLLYSILVKYILYTISNNAKNNKFLFVDMP